MKSFASLAVALMALAWLPGSANAQPTSDLVVEDASILARNDIEIAAEAEGTLSKLSLRVGAVVAKGDLLATIDERQAQAAIDVAVAAHAAAIQKAEDDIEEQYGKAAFDVAKAEYRANLLANQQKAGSIPPIQVEKVKLEARRAELQIEKAKKDRVIAGREAEVKAAELRAAEINLDRRSMKAPFAGQVLERFRDEAEWVNPGDPVVRLMQFDLLYCDGYVDAAAHDPSEVADRPVTVKVISAQGERSAKGRIVYASQEVEGTDFKIRAEFENQQDAKGFWLVRPGQTATITIHLDQPPVETAAK